MFIYRYMCHLYIDIVTGYIIHAYPNPNTGFQIRVCVCLYMVGGSVVVGVVYGAWG